MKEYESGELDESIAYLSSQSPAHGVRKALRTLVPVYIDGELCIPKNVCFSLSTNFKYIYISSLLLHIFTISWNTLYGYFFWKLWKTHRY